MRLPSRLFSAPRTFVCGLPLLLLLLLFLTVSVMAQARGVNAHYGARPLSLLGRSSGYIFVGTVMGIAMTQADSQNAVGFVQITFHVENALRGVRNGQTLMVREWAGLWESGEQYRVGERVMLYLFRPGKLGLTSPVGGALGRFRIDPYGHVLLNRGQMAAVAGDPVLSGRLQGKNRVTWQEFSRGIHRAAEGE